ncbi:uncharacterized protein RSE6_03446 [Rhynchosporium secalis]|uniref:Uncharacterized protein n=1 Tax=Rhynchosporium secalis TaxID=38038 RepID=A0A1E1M2S9_RHYSE|nr:uncharacterized protein RSE6_03446 [Rhynchosporium secalis]
MASNLLAAGRQTILYPDPQEPSVKIIPSYITNNPDVRKLCQCVDDLTDMATKYSRKRRLEVTQIT